MSAGIFNPVKSSPIRDVYRFGDGPEPVLQPGTMGWSAADLEDPQVRRLWEQGRFEIIDGVLITMPAAYFRGGQCCAALMLVLQPYLKSRHIPSLFSTETDIQVNASRLLRADVAAVFGDDLARFKALNAATPERDWQNHPLIIAPTLVIESVSQGHEAHDRRNKRKWYAEFGVRHYWIVDAYTKSLECLLLQDGQYLDDGTGQGIDLVKPASFPDLNISLPEVWGD